MRNDVVNYYNRRKADRIEEFHKGSFCIVLTSDVWTERSSEDYISVVTHYVDDEWKLQKSRFLPCRCCTHWHEYL